ncbi:sugar transferase [bacterium]|nr:sugar transferase [bacterium]
MKRFFDVTVSLLRLVVFLRAFLVGAGAVKLTSKEPIYYLSAWISVSNSHFDMLKLRTMRKETPHVAILLMTDPKIFFTAIGDSLSKSCLVELPQLINVIKGEMSIVGLRPRFV